MALSVSRDKTLRLWNLLEGRCAYIKRLQGEGELVRWSSAGDRWVPDVSGFFPDLCGLEGGSDTHTLLVLMWLEAVDRFDSVFLSKGWGRGSYVVHIHTYGK